MSKTVPKLTGFIFIAQWHFLLLFIPSIHHCHYQNGSRPFTLIQF